MKDIFPEDDEFLYMGGGEPESQSDSETLSDDDDVSDENDLDIETSDDDINSVISPAGDDDTIPPAFPPAGDEDMFSPAGDDVGATTTPSDDGVRPPSVSIPPGDMESQLGPIVTATATTPSDDGPVVPSDAASDVDSHVDPSDAATTLSDVDPVVPSDSATTLSDVDPMVPSDAATTPSDVDLQQGDAQEVPSDSATTLSDVDLQQGDAQEVPSDAATTPSDVDAMVPNDAATTPSDVDLQQGDAQDMASAPVSMLPGSVGTIIQRVPSFNDAQKIPEDDSEDEDSNEDEWEWESHRLRVPTFKFPVNASYQDIKEHYERNAGVFDKLMETASETLQAPLDVFHRAYVLLADTPCRDFVQKYAQAWNDLMLRVYHLQMDCTREAVIAACRNITRVDISQLLCMPVAHAVRIQRMLSSMPQAQAMGEAIDALYDAHRNLYFRGWGLRTVGHAFRKLRQVVREVRAVDEESCDAFLAQYPPQQVDDTTDYDVAPYTPVVKQSMAMALIARNAPKVPTSGSGDDLYQEIQANYEYGNVKAQALVEEHAATGDVEVKLEKYRQAYTGYMSTTSTERADAYRQAWAALLGAILHLQIDHGCDDVAASCRAITGIDLARLVCEPKDLLAKIRRAMFASPGSQRKIDDCIRSLQAAAHSGVMSSVPAWWGMSSYVETLGDISDTIKEMRDGYRSLNKGSVVELCDRFVLLYPPQRVAVDHVYYVETSSPGPTTTTTKPGVFSRMMSKVRGGGPRAAADVERLEIGTAVYGAKVARIATWWVALAVAEKLVARKPQRPREDTMYYTLAVALVLHACIDATIVAVLWLVVGWDRDIVLALVLDYIMCMALVSVAAAVYFVTVRPEHFRGVLFIMGAVAHLLPVYLAFGPDA